MQSAHKSDTYRGKKEKYSPTNLSCKMDITDLKCKLCGKNFDLLPGFKEHLIREHGVEFIREEKSFVIEFKLSDGQVMHCALCSATFEAFQSLLLHMNNHYRNFICKECDVGFINEHKLIVHEKTHKRVTFKCRFCTEVFPTYVRKRNHEKRAHLNTDRTRRKCPLCTETFTSYFSRNKHILEDHKSTATSYKCSICDKIFVIKKNLTLHIRSVHQKERNYKCSECGRDFFTTTLLRNHMVRHTGEKIHKCTVCHNAYARRKTLKVHMRIHNNDNRFKCELCGLAFVQKSTLKSHSLCRHGVNL